MNTFDKNYLGHSFLYFITDDYFGHSFLYFITDDYCRSDYECSKCKIRILYCCLASDGGKKEYIEVNDTTIFSVIKLSCEEQIIKNIIE